MKNTIDTVWPKLYSCRPAAPIADIIDALGIHCVFMDSSRARRVRSVCVVALYLCQNNMAGGLVER